MNERAGGRGRGRWCRGWPRRAAVLAVTAGIVLLAAACGSGSSATARSPSSSSASSAAQQELAYAQCMRSHGVPNFPDPHPAGGFGDTTQVQSDPNYASADSACKSLLPNGGTGKGSQNEDQLLQIAQCMRTHGVPKYPDPNPNPTVNPRIALAQAGIDVNSPQFQSASQICERLYPLPSRGPSTGGTS
jgi:hypothetical protein